MTATGIFLCFWAMLIVTRGSPFGERLHRLMVDRPATLLSRIGRGHVAVAAALTILVALLVWTGGNDAIRMVGMASPEVAAWLSTVEISVVMDALVAAATAFSVARFASMRGWLAAVATRAGRLGRRRARRRRLAATRAGADNDDEGHGVVWMAA